MSPDSKNRDTLGSKNRAAHLNSLKSIAADVLETAESNFILRKRPPLDIQSNSLYEASFGEQRIVLKEFLKPDEFEQSPLREYSAMRLLSHLDIAPQPRAMVPPNSDHNPIVVYDFMDGEMWDRRIPSPGELRQLADLWIRMNELPGDDLWLSRNQETSILDVWQGVGRQLEDYSEWGQLNFPAARQAADSALDLYQQREETSLELSTAEVPLCFCRSDPRFANVISRPDGRLGMVDWEDSGLRDPALDLADIMTHPNQEDLLTHQQWKSFLEHYMDYRGRLDPGLERRFHLYLGLLPVWWLSILLAVGMSKSSQRDFDQWRIHGMDPNQKIIRYLARALAWPDFESVLMHEELADIRFFPVNRAPAV